MSSSPESFLVFPILSAALAIALLFVIPKLREQSENTSNPATPDESSPPPSCFETDEEEIELLQCHPCVPYILHALCLGLPALLFALLLLRFGTEKWPSYLPIWGTYSNGLSSFLFATRTLRWRCSGSKLVKDFVRLLAAVVAVITLMLVPGTGCMLYFSLEHTGLLSAALLSFLSIFLVGASQTSFQLLNRKTQDPRPAIAVFTFFALVILILDLVLPLKALKSSDERNVAAWFLSFMPPLWAVVKYVYRLVEAVWRESDKPNSSIDYKPEAKKNRLTSLKRPQTEDPDNSGRPSRHHILALGDPNNPHSNCAMSLAWNSNLSIQATRPMEPRVLV